MDGSRPVTSFQLDPAAIEELSGSVLSLAEQLSRARSGPAASTGTGSLDRVLADFWAVLDRGLVELGNALRAHGLDAAAAGAWYRRVELAQATGR